MEPMRSPHPHGFSCSVCLGGDSSKYVISTLPLFLNQLLGGPAEIRESSPTGMGKSLSADRPTIISVKHILLFFSPSCFMKEVVADVI